MHKFCAMDQLIHNVIDMDNCKVPIYLFFNLNFSIIVFGN